MAASCSGDGAAACSDGDDHIRRIAGVVALKKAEVESNIYTVRRPDYVGEAVEEGRAEASSDPGPFSEDVSMDDFLPRPRRGSVLFLTFSDVAGDEVILYFPFCYPVEHFVIKFWRLIGISVC
jgi:hypothetical protein